MTEYENACQNLLRRSGTPKIGRRQTPDAKTGDEMMDSSVRLAWEVLRDALNAHGDCPVQYVRQLQNIGAYLGVLK